MQNHAPLAELPDEVTFTLHEVAAILFVVDLAVERTEVGGQGHAEARAARRLVSGRLWPGLGDLLDDGGERVANRVETMDVDEARMTAPEAARRLQIAGAEVYRLLFSGELDGGPVEDGAVYLTVRSVDRYLQLASPEPQRP